RIKNAVGVCDLIERRGAFGAVAPTRAWMLRVSFELLHLQALAVYIGQKPARRLAVEAGRRHERIAALLFLRPRARIQFYPIIPALLRRKHSQMNTARPWIKGFAPAFGFTPRRAHATIQLFRLLLLHILIERESMCAPSALRTISWCMTTSTEF